MARRKMTESTHNDVSKRKNFCVYTVLIGKYENLNEQPLAINSEIEFFCLTDDVNLRSDTWKIRHVDPIFIRDPIRSQRDIKIRPHFYLRDFESSLYIDNTVIIKEKPEKFIELLFDAPDGIVIPPHSFRDTLMDEFIEVARLGLDENSRIFEQFNHYLLDDPEAFDERPWWSGLMVRNHNHPKMIQAAEIWSNHVMRYSRRDQLSANVAFRSVGLQPRPLVVDAFGSELHSWPHKAGRDRGRGERTIMRSMMPLAGRLRAMEQIEAKLVEAEANLSKFEARFAELEVERLKILQSSSWRITAPLRRAARFFPRLTLAVKRILKTE
jgi:hypothetical protein